VALEWKQPFARPSIFTAAAMLKAALMHLLALNGAKEVLLVVIGRQARL